jgi:hypothetical protein
MPEADDRTLTNIKVRLCSEDAGGLQAPINIAVGPGEQRSPCIATMVAPDLGTRTAMAWIDDTVSGPNASVGLKASVLGRTDPVG